MRSRRARATTAQVSAETRREMKVRIGIGLGRGATDLATFCEVLDSMESNGFDSIWLSEVLTVDSFDPFVGLAFAAARKTRLKLGTTMLLPGRNVVRLAKQLASLDLLSEGRLLVTFVPGLDQQPERDAIGPRSLHRAMATEAALPLLRQMLAGERVSHHGVLGDFDEVRISPLPVQQPLEFWLGGIAPPALERCGAFGDGWLPSLCSLEDARRGKKEIEDVAARHGRAISGEHFGVSVPYAHSAEDLSVLSARGARRNNAELVPIGLDALRRLLESYIEADFSKFVVRPLRQPASWANELADLAAAVADLQN
jgi:probable F420-dependent oxidoreductase